MPESAQMEREGLAIISMKARFKIKKQIAIIMAMYIVSAIVAGFIVFKQAMDDKDSIALAGSGDNVTGWAWNNVVGWISMNSIDCDQDANGFIDYGQCGGDNSTKPTYDYGVNIDSGTGIFSGYAWNPTVGWINFGPASGYPSAPNTPATKDLVTGKITGWAKIESLGDDGWIRMDHSLGYRCSSNGQLYPSNPACISGCNVPNTLCTAGPDVNLVTLGTTMRTQNPVMGYSCAFFPMPGFPSNWNYAYDGNVNTYFEDCPEYYPPSINFTTTFVRPTIVRRAYLKAYGSRSLFSALTMQGSPTGLQMANLPSGGNYNATTTGPFYNVKTMNVSLQNWYQDTSAAIYEVNAIGPDPNTIRCPGTDPMSPCSSANFATPMTCLSRGSCTAETSNKNLIASTTTGEFSGWAWNGNSNSKGIGWISFNNMDCDTNGNGFFDAACGGDDATTLTKNYKVVTSGRPNAPINVSADELPDTCKSIKVDWTDNSANEDGFIAEIKGASSTCPACWEYFCENSSYPGIGSLASCSGPTPLTPAHIAPDPNSTYAFRVKSYLGGVFSDPEPSAGFNTTTAFCAPVLADVLTAEANCGGITLRWTQEGSGVDHYEIWREKNNEGFVLLKDDISQASSTYIDKSIDKTNGSRYKYYVNTQNGNIDSNQIGPINPCPKSPKWKETKTD